MDDLYTGSLYKAERYCAVEHKKVICSNSVMKDKSNKSLWKTLGELNISSQKNKYDLPNEPSDVDVITRYFVESAQNNNVFDEKKALHFYDNNAKTG
ncbi:hypothetical protein JTB14_020887 [Gonioctena quinquepunctata]|nr:hypothetical protein JTB14_020887 [Gonioctena quinquepunctata]